jgi:hypothetical protein
MEAQRQPSTPRPTLAEHANHRCKTLAMDTISPARTALVVTTTIYPMGRQPLLSVARCTTAQAASSQRPMQRSSSSMPPIENIFCQRSRTEISTVRQPWCFRLPSARVNVQKPNRWLRYRSAIVIPVRATALVAPLAASICKGSNVEVIFSSSIAQSCERRLERQHGTHRELHCARYRLVRCRDDRTPNSRDVCQSQ